MYYDKEDKQLLEQYDAMLNEVYGEIVIGYGNFTASEVLAKLSPEDYRIGFVDFKQDLQEQLDNQ